MAYQDNNPYYGGDSLSFDGGTSDHNRFESGSSRNFDQAPSIHVCKSRARQYYPDEDCSERSFQLGVDPIERDWGDSQSVSRCGLDQARCGGSSRHSNNSSIPSIATRERNAMNKPRRRDYGYDGDDKNCGNGYEGDCSESGYSFHEERTQDTHSLTTASLYSRSPEQNERDERPRYPCLGDHNDDSHNHRGMRRGSASIALQDHFEKAAPSRPGPRRSSVHNSDAAVSLNSSMRSQGSFCSRSAPLRRTRIAREPSMYSANSGKLCNISRRSLTFDSRRGGDKKNSQWQSQNRRASNCSSLSSMPPLHIKIDVAQARDQRRQAAETLEPTMVDIAPGVQTPLRGAKETVTAVARDYYANVSCFGCSLEVCCIADVSYVICPVCKVVSPMDDPTFEGKEVQRHGLGLGFTYESLFKMQLEILEDRTRVHS